MIPPQPARPPSLQAAGAPAQVKRRRRRADNGRVISSRTEVWPNLLRFARDASLAILAASVTGLSRGGTFGPHDYGDLRVFRSAGQAVLDGRSPYPPATARVLRKQDNFVYPAPAAIAMTPLAPMPLPLAAVVFMAASAAALVAALCIAGL